MLCRQTGLGLGRPPADIEDQENVSTAQAQRFARGVCRMLAHLGYETLTEFRLPPRRRVDVIGLNGDGLFIVVEIKTTIEDFRADRKWHEYRA